MVARHYGLDPDPDALLAAAYIPALGGTTPEVLLHAAPTAGLASRAILPATPENPAPIFDALSAGRPVILLLAPASGAADPTLGHFLVATGFRPGTRALRVHTGNTPNRWLPAKSWLPRLASALLVAP